ncbi:hypothetical protein FNF31_02898 [Cafeteria roenbergensis]|uniref:AB hydrolase-1 domain-containing protein n=1 Tax=Cafeteria roenbergensis TaxID=33653 RepID=A0A5A8DFW5_CAFRO|nr:hypothetical protein FNF31_02898 [Cafeteria roenbergensis]
MASGIPGDHMSKATVGAPPGTSQVRIGRLELECGRVIEDAVLAASTYGTLNAAGTNAVIVGHSLTSDSHVHQWWSKLLSATGTGSDGSHAEAPGHGKCLDTRRFFVVCFNYLGSCYGSSSPLTEGGFAAFPVPVTMRDQARAMLRAARMLGVNQVALAIGGSMGAMLALEIGLEGGPTMVRSVCAVAGCARHTDWATGHSEVQRRAIFADPLWRGGAYPADRPPREGLGLARMAAMLTYRTAASFESKFARQGAHRPCPSELEAQAGDWSTSARGTAPDGASVDTTGGIAQAPPARKPRAGAVAADARTGSPEPTPARTTGQGASGVSLPYWSVESYLHHQGGKFPARFDPGCYVALTYTLDTHDVGRGRGGVEAALARLEVPLLVVGVDSDGLYPLGLQQRMARAARFSTLAVLSSPHGHDGFLVEIDRLNEVIVEWMSASGPRSRL